MIAASPSRLALQAAISLAALGLGFGLGFGCSAPHRRTPGDEYVQAIRFEGNRALRSRTLVAGLALERARKLGDAPDPYQIVADRDRILGKYLREGYLDVDVRARVDRSGDATTVTYAVDEGTRAVTRVEIFGIPDDPELSVSTIRARIPLAEGAPFSYATYDATKQVLIQLVEDAGYAHAKLDATVYADRGTHQAVITLDFELGPRCVFGPVTITGATGALAAAVRARLAFAPGDRYSTRALAETRRALSALGRFSAVQVQPTSGGSPVVGVAIAVAEAAPRTVELGGGLAMDPQAFELRGRAGYSITGWPGPLDTAAVELRPAYALLRGGNVSEPRIRAVGRLARQDLLWTYARGEAEVGYTYLSTLPYTSYGPHAGLALTTRILTRRLQLRVGWSIEHFDFLRPSSGFSPALAVALGLDHSQRVAAYSQTASIDLRDHPMEPLEGVYAEARVSEGTRFAGGRAEFLEVMPDVRAYLPIWRPARAVVASRVRVGSIVGDIPVTERLFSGGASSQRGFAERRLAPFVVDAEGNPIPYGGAGLLELGVEVRSRLVRFRDIPIGGVAFLDGGDVRERLSEIDLGNLHWAIGLGLRAHTVVGPVRADLGYRITRTGPLEPAAGSRFAFHLSLGEAF